MPPNVEEMLRWHNWRRWTKPTKVLAAAAVLVSLAAISGQGLLAALDRPGQRRNGEAASPSAPVASEPLATISLARPQPVAATLSPSERGCLASAIYHEARGEPADGQIAVAQVVLNRVRSGRWPSTVCGVVYQDAQRGEKCQFSFACRRNAAKPKPGEPDWDNALALAEAVVAGQAPLGATATATHYHTEEVHPVWRLGLKPLGQIGRHLFYEEGRRGEIDRVASVPPSVTAVAPRKPRTRPERPAVKAPPQASATDAAGMFAVERN